MEVYESIVYKENFKTSIFGKTIKILLNLRLKYKNEGNGVMQRLVNLLKKSLNGEISRKDIPEEYSGNLE